MNQNLNDLQAAAEFRKLQEAASPMPWALQICEQQTASQFESHAFIHGAKRVSIDHSWAMSPEDAALLFQSRDTDLPARIERLVGEVEALKALVREWFRVEEDERDRLRREYPAGTCNAEDAWSDWSKERDKVRKQLIAAASEPGKRAAGEE